jgi:hypothetical protein
MPRDMSYFDTQEALRKSLKSEFIDVYAIGIRFANDGMNLCIPF